MRITLLSPVPNYSGGVRVIAVYADYLQRFGHEVLVVFPRRPMLKPRGRIRSFRRGEGFMPDILTPRPASHYDDVDVPVKMMAHEGPATPADLPDADVLVATYWLTAQWAMDMPPEKGVKVGFFQGHEVYLPRRAAQVRAVWRLPFYKVVVSEWLASIARREYGQDHFAVVPNAVDTRQFFADPRPRNDSPAVGLLYSAEHFRGCDIAFAAYRLLKRRMPTLRLRAFGKEHESPAAPFPEGMEYEYRPAQDRIREIYSACDVWLFPSRSEGFGLPILEAMACRTPVVGCPAGAAPQLLEGGGGMLVLPESPRAMAEAAHTLLTCPEEDWQEQSLLAYQTATSYTWEDAARRFEHALQDAVRQNGASESVA